MTEFQQFGSRSMDNFSAQTSAAVTSSATIATYTDVQSNDYHEVGVLLNDLAISDDGSIILSVAAVIDSSDVELQSVKIQAHDIMTGEDDKEHAYKKLAFHVQPNVFNSYKVKAALDSTGTGTTSIAKVTVFQLR